MDKRVVLAGAFVMSVMGLGEIVSGTSLSTSGAMGLGLMWLGLALTE